MSDLIGQTFGDLTVGRSLGSNHRQERVWLCRCSCGGAAIRTTAALRASVKRGHVPCCARCHREVWHGAIIAARTEHVDAWLGLWDRYGTLWSQATLDRMESDIRAEVGEELGGWDERPTLPVEVVEPEDGTDADWRTDCDGPDEPTLSAIGAEFGVSRERARQIVLQALQSFSKSWAKMFPRDHLSRLLFGDDARRSAAVVRMVEIDAAIAAAQRAA